MRENIQQCGCSLGRYPSCTGSPHGFSVRIFRFIEASRIFITLIHTYLALQEARGLDAGPRLVKRLMGFGDHRTSKIVAKIAEEEVAHVAVGVDWFLSVCQKMNRAPCPTFKGI